MCLCNQSMSSFLYSLVISCFAGVCLISSAEGSKNGGLTVDLIHRDSSHSPFYDPSSTRFDLLRRQAERSFSRKSYMASAIKPTQSFQSSSIPSGGEYLMKISVGTPPVETLAIADTGSDLTWIQCQPCRPCFKQNGPIFHPKGTKTYKKLSCKANECAALGVSSCGKKQRCLYSVMYADRSFTNGDLSVDSFSFSSAAGNSVSFQKVVFGCGRQNVGNFSSGSGIVGLGGGKLSIVNQLSKSSGGKFSYCLTPPESNVPSKISFGSEAAVAGPNVVSTPLVKKYPDAFYYVTLEGFSVGEKKLKYKSHSQKSVEEINIIIDSGTTLTYLPSDLTKSLESELGKAIKAKRTSVSEPSGVFNLCYELPPDGKLKHPPITAHFRGADVVLPEETTFMEVKKGVACLNLVASPSLSVFGNWHQRNYRIGYDLVKRQVSFQPTDCTKAQ